MCKWFSMPLVRISLFYIFAYINKKVLIWRFLEMIKIKYLLAQEKLVCFTYHSVENIMTKKK